MCINSSIRMLNEHLRNIKFVHEIAWSMLISLCQVLYMLFVSLCNWKPFSAISLWAPLRLPVVFILFISFNPESSILSFCCSYFLPLFLFFFFRWNISVFVASIFTMAFLTFFIIFFSMHIIKKTYWIVWYLVNSVLFNGDMWISRADITWDRIPNFLHDCYKKSYYVRYVGEAMSLREWDLKLWFSRREKFIKFWYIWRSLVVIRFIDKTVNVQI